MEITVKTLRKNGVHFSVLEELVEMHGSYPFPVNKENLLCMSRLTYSLRWFAGLFLPAYVYDGFYRWDIEKWKEVELSMKPLWDEYLTNTEDIHQRYNHPNLSMKEAIQANMELKPFREKLRERQDTVCLKFSQDSAETLAQIIKKKGL